MARKLTDTGTGDITEVLSGDLIYVVRPSLGASGSKRITVEDLEESLNQLSGKHIYVIGGQMLEPQPASAVILAPHVPPVDILLPELGNLSAGKALVAATNDTVFSIKKNGVEIGIMTVLAGQTVPSFTFFADVSLTGGADYLTVINPASPDPTLALLGFAIYARR